MKIPDRRRMEENSRRLLVEIGKRDYIGKATSENSYGSYQFKRDCGLGREEKAWSTKKRGRVLISLVADVHPGDLDLFAISCRHRIFFLISCTPMPQQTTPICCRWPSIAEWSTTITFLPSTVAGLVTQ